MISLTGMSCDVCAQELQADQPVIIKHAMCETGLYLSLEQLEAIKSVTYHQYIHYDNIEANRVIKLICDFVDESAKGKKH